MSRTTPTTRRALAAVALAAAIPASAQLINLDFGTTSTAYTGAAAIGSAGDFWNTWAPGDGTVGLDDTAGAATAATFRSDPVIVDNDFYFDPIDYNSWDGNTLMNEAVYGNGEVTRLILGGLDDSLQYTLYIYGEMSGSEITDVSIVGGPTKTITTDGSRTSFVEATAGNAWAGNYVVFTNISPVGGEIAFEMSNGGWHGLNGFQVSAIPEPSTVATTLGTAALLAAGWSRRRRS
jgi:hypothetical protein